jgi:hypothetical protein
MFYDLAAVLDLDGDGTLEVVVSWLYYEGSGLEAYEIGSEGVTRVLNGGCGA